MIADVDEDSFDYKVLASEKPVLAVFWAPWCEPCTRLAPVIEEVARIAGDRASVVRINTDENGELAFRLQVSGTPTSRIYRNGAAAASVAGVRTASHLLKLLLPE